jgi:hypothetical protein
MGNTSDATIEQLLRLEQTVEFIRRWLNPLKLSPLAALGILLALYGMTLATHPIGARVPKRFGQYRKGVSTVLKVLTTVSYFSFFGTEPGPLAFNPTARIARIQSDYREFGRRVEHVVEQQVAVEVASRIVDSLPPEVARALEAQRALQTHLWDLADAYQRAEARDVRPSNGSRIVNQLSGAAHGREGEVPTNLSESRVQRLVADAQAAEMSAASRLQSLADYELAAVKELSSAFADVPKARIKSELVDALFDDHPLLGKIVDVVVDAIDGVAKQRKDQVIEEIVRSQSASPRALLGDVAQQYAAELVENVPAPTIEREVDRLTAETRQTMALVDRAQVDLNTALRYHVSALWPGAQVHRATMQLPPTERLTGARAIGFGLCAVPCEQYLSFAKRLKPEAQMDVLLNTMEFIRRPTSDASTTFTVMTFSDARAAALAKATSRLEAANAANLEAEFRAAVAGLPRAAAEGSTELVSQLRAADGLVGLSSGQLTAWLCRGTSNAAAFRGCYPG